jgi:hypothetical protein
MTPTARRRAGVAAAAIAIGAGTLAAAVVAAIWDPPAGPAVLLGLAVAAWLAWRGAARGPTARPVSHRRRPAARVPRGEVAHVAGISSRHPDLSPSALLPPTPSATVTELARVAAGHG